MKAQSILIFIIHCFAASLDAQTKDILQQDSFLKAVVTWQLGFSFPQRKKDEKSRLWG